MDTAGEGHEEVIAEPHRTQLHRGHPHGSGNVKPTSGANMTEYGMFPVSVIIAGFCVMSLAYLICFCCCIIQFFVRRNRALGSSINNPSVEGGVTKQKNDKLKNHFCRQYLNSLKRFNKNRSPDQVLADSSCVGFCPICFEEYKGDPADNFVGLIKTCGHFFHFNCIWEWLENHQTCPLCRGAAKLRESDIKGLSLRHVDAYKECALAQENSGSMVKTVPSEGVVEVGTSEHSAASSSAPETAVEATEDARNACANVQSEEQGPLTNSGIVVAVDIEDNSDLSHSGQATAMDTNAESSYQVAVLTPREDSRNSRTMSHDNKAFVVDETT